jgi:hypothetical protein
VTAGDVIWLAPAFVAIWLAICVLLSMIGGWHELSRRFESDTPIDGELFRFASGVMGYPLFTVNYRRCLSMTVGPRGIALAVAFPFRLLHPRLVIPWSAVERCELVTYWFAQYVAVHAVGFRRRLLFRGAVGDRILETCARSSRAHEGRT